MPTPPPRRPPFDPPAQFRSFDHLQAVLETPGALVVVVDLEGRIVSFNRGAERMLGERRKRWLGRRWRRLFAKPEQYRRIRSLLRRKGKILDHETALRAKDGSRVPITLTVTRLADAAGRAYGQIAVAMDVSRRVRLARQLRAKSAHLEAILEHSPDMIITTDTEGRIIDFSPAAERTLGFRRAQMLGKPAADLYARPQERAALLARLSRQETIQDAEIQVRTRAGAVLDVATSISFLKDEDDQVVGTVGIARDITRRKELERELDRLSRTDVLTGLGNRREFFEALHRHVDSGLRGDPLSMLYLDMDRFKQLNDRRGHLAGDGALRDLATALRKVLPMEGALAYRCGGDEFVALLPGLDAAQAMLLAERVRRAFARRPRPAGGKDDTTVSIGVTQFRPKDRIDEAIGRADQAMYAAKRAGGNRAEML